MEKVDSYTRFCAVLTAYAESDFDPTRTRNGSIGVYQQTLPWWTNDRLDVRSACRAFIHDFTGNAWQHTGQPLPDCWLTQRWQAPDPGLDLSSFLAAESTANYAGRVKDVSAMISRGTVR
jgi:hypothetical protein